MAGENQRRARGIEQRIERRKQSIAAAGQGRIRQGAFSGGGPSAARARTSTRRSRPVWRAKRPAKFPWCLLPEKKPPPAGFPLRRSMDWPASARASTPKRRLWETAPPKPATEESEKD